MFLLSKNDITVINITMTFVVMLLEASLLVSTTTADAFAYYQRVGG